MIRARAGVVSIALVALSLVAGCTRSAALVPRASVPFAPQPSVDAAERILEAYVAWSGVARVAVDPANKPTQGGSSHHWQHVPVESCNL